MTLLNSAPMTDKIEFTSPRLMDYGQRVTFPSPLGSQNGNIKANVILSSSGYEEVELKSFESQETQFVVIHSSPRDKKVFLNVAVSLEWIEQQSRIIEEEIWRVLNEV